MSQPTDSDYSQASGASGTAIRTNEADYFAGILTKNSGTTAPATTFAGMWWIDTSQSPPELNLRNQANSGWDVVANIDPTTGVEWLSQGAAVVALGNTAAFTEPQTIDKTGAAGTLTVKSDRTNGIAASVDFAGHDDGANDTTYASLDAEITDDTDGSEDGQLVHRVIQGGSEVARMTVGATVDVNGTMNATTVQQGGTSLSSIIATEKGNAGSDTETGTTRIVPDDVTAGDRNRFTGSSPTTWTINTDVAGNIYPVRNRGTADITFVAGAGVTIEGGLTLAPNKVCTIDYDNTNFVFIYGQNT